MASITLKGNPISTAGELPAVGSKAPDFELVKTDMGSVSLADLSGKTVILNISPSIDTSICADSVRKFNETAAAKPGTAVLYVSADLPFAHKRFCEGEGIDGVIAASVFRSGNFGSDYGVTMTSGPLAGLLSRAVVVIGPDGTVRYTEQVPEIAQEPDYDAALAAIG